MDEVKTIDANEVQRGDTLLSNGAPVGGVLDRGVIRHVRPPGMGYVVTRPDGGYAYVEAGYFHAPVQVACPHGARHGHDRDHEEPATLTVREMDVPALPWKQAVQPSGEGKPCR